MTAADLDLVLSWRNRDDIRRVSLDSKEITREEHAAWFERVKDSPVRMPLIFTVNATPRGLVRFVPILKNLTWGFYLSDPAQKGRGTPMAILALDHAFNHLGAEAVTGDVLKRNEASIRFHEKLGFRRHIDGAGIAIFELTPEAWAKKRPELIEKLASRGITL